MKKIYSLIAAVALTSLATAQTNRAVSAQVPVSKAVSNQITASVATPTSGVLFPVSVTTCTNDAYILTAGTGTAYIGYIAGTNDLGDLQKAQKYNLTNYGLTTPATVTGVGAFIGYATGSGSVTAKIYADNAGAVGAQLGSASIPVAVSSINTNSLTTFAFATPVSLTGSTFYVAIDMSGLNPAAGDTIAIVSTSTCTANGSGAYEQWDDATWHSFVTSWASSYTMDLYIFPAVTAETVGIKENKGIVSSLNVFPNPAANDITINYTLSTATVVEVEVYDMTGKLVKGLAAQSQEVGSHSTKIDISSLEAGIYMYGIKANGSKAFGKFNVVK